MNPPINVPLEYPHFIWKLLTLFYQIHMNFIHLKLQEDRMNKLELITALKDEARITKTEAERVANLFFNAMAEALEKGDRVEVRGLCSFYVKKYRAYTGRNPKTG